MRPYPPPGRLHQKTAFFYTVQKHAISKYNLATINIYVNDYSFFTESTLLFLVMEYKLSYMFDIFVDLPARVC